MAWKKAMLTSMKAPVIIPALGVVMMDSRPTPRKLASKKVTGLLSAPVHGRRGAVLPGKRLASFSMGPPKVRRATVKQPKVSATTVPITLPELFVVWSRKSELSRIRTKPTAQNETIHAGTDHAVLTDIYVVLSIAVRNALMASASCGVASSKSKVS